MDMPLLISSILQHADRHFGDTDRGEAAAATAGAPPGRFVWIDSARVNATKRREVLAALFVADTAATSLTPEHR